MRSSRLKLTRGGFLWDNSERFFILFLAVTSFILRQFSYYMHINPSKRLRGLGCNVGSDGTFLCSIFKFFCGHNCIFTLMKAYCRLSPCTKILFNLCRCVLERAQRAIEGMGEQAQLVVGETFKISHMSPPPGHTQGLTKVLPKENYLWTRKETILFSQMRLHFCLCSKNVKNKCSDQNNLNLSVWHQPGSTLCLLYLYV